ncbi:MAG: 3-dehydro-bile acid delta(4,6)-reductase [Syntrophus sp. SKADARSKE-3]|nr:3-dehydro-bile acid delta(4,6)-reductase [Syntrophus sp. SKADARSKE-3]
MISTDKQQVIVVGAGASGMMAAGAAAASGARVIILEKMSRPGEKLHITGKTRCNVTNSRELKAFIAMFGPNGSFLYRAFHTFFRDELTDFLHHQGVEMKTERGGRIFPVSDQAADVVDAFVRYLDQHDVVLKTQVRVTGMRVEDGRVLGVDTDTGFVPAGAVIIATGGSTWPGTGSSGDGYRMAGKVGHKVTKLRPALVPLIVHEIDLAKSMQGIALRNVRLTAFGCLKEDIDPLLTPTTDIGRGIAGKRPRKPVIESRFGEMMFTHFGIGGPVTLLLSLAVVDALENGPVSVSIDLKPAMTREQLHQRIQGDLDRYGKRSWRRIMEGLLPSGMIEAFCTLSGIDPEKPAHQISGTERGKAVSLLKSLCFQVKSPLPMSSAIVTAGGVSLNEIDPRTMESLKISGLFFCGEVLDLDADTGGYNLQAAFSTGYVAGQAAAAYIREDL